MMKYKAITMAVAAALASPALLAAPAVKSIEFTATPAPASLDDSTHAYTESSAVVTYRNGRQKVFPLSYNALYNSGDEVGGWKAGSIVDMSGTVLQTAIIDEN
jgi:hypothetical protein